MAMEYRPALVMVKSTGRIHRVVVEYNPDTGQHRTLSDERCQHDQMGPTVEIAEVEKAEPDDFCGHCWAKG